MISWSDKLEENRLKLFKVNMKYEEKDSFDDKREKIVKW